MSGPLPKSLSVPLANLYPSARNVRKTGGQSIDDLAASIKAEGLLSNLNVMRVPQDDGGERYEVVAGQRRLAALKLLAKNGDIAVDYRVPCRLVDEDRATSTSLAENAMREALHPADQFDAFKKMADEGKSIEDIAAAFGVTALIVRRRLRLANVAPELLEVFRKDKMSIEQVTALAVTDDQEAQKAVWGKARGEWEKSPERLRERLTVKEIDATRNPVARFVGTAAYIAAGGVVRTDLFSDGDAGFLQDETLLHKLAQQKLDAIAAKELAKGWAWAQTSLEFRWEEFHAFRRDFHLDGKFTPAQMKTMGVLVSIEDGGKLRIDRGLRKPGERSADGSANTKRKKPKGDISEKLRRMLTTERTLALQCELMKRTDIALAVLVHAMLLDAEHIDAKHDSPSTLRVRSSYTPGQAAMPEETLKASRANKAVDQRKRELFAKLPKKGDELFGWLLKQPRDKVLELLALCVAETIDALANRSDDANELASALALDMTACWTVTPENYLNHVSRAQVLEAITEACGKKEADALAGEKKTVLAAKALPLLTKAKWLPKILRAPGAPKAAAKPKAKKKAKR